MSKYILGIDAGGTKTHGALADENGSILALVSNSGANWERYGIAAAQQTLTAVVRDLLQQTEIAGHEVGSATFALAGIDWPQDLDLFNGFTESLSFGGPTSIINDSFAALYAGVPSGIGAISIAGTGGKTAVSNGLESLQTMGMELGEGGGGGELISLAVEKAAQNFHRGVTTSKLTQLLLNNARCETPLDFFYEVARNGLRMNETLAPAIFALANQGDEESVSIVARVARHHAEDVIALCDRIQFQVPVTVVRAGGLHTAGNSIFDSSFEDSLKAATFKYELVRLEISPSYGSVIHAGIDFFKGLNSNFSNRVIDEARKREGL